MTFMINQGQPPFPISINATMNIVTTAPLAGRISVPAVGVSNAPFQGTAADSSGGTTFNFSTNIPPDPPPPTVLEGYGMQIVCGTDTKLMGGMNIVTTPGLPASDPNEDACWLATHSVGAGGDEDGDGEEKYGR